jgi:type I restriction enzyme S subunit
MRVVPDAEKIPPGYLYAYLSSKFGVPLVVGGTYGAIIQHIEPEHIANLPVPRSRRHREGSGELMATVIPIGEPVNEAERQAIAHLRDHLPASYLVLHNFEIVRDGETFEVDVASSRRTPCSSST